MKNFKKILSGVLVASAMASCLAIPTYADVVYDNLTVEVDEGGYKTYYLPDDFTIQSVLDDKDQTLVLNGKKLKFERKTIHDFNEEFMPEDRINCNYDFIAEDDGIEFCYALYDIEHVPESEVTNKIIFESVDIISPEPDNKDDLTIGNSNPTGVRGDINYDGKVTTADLLLLKKYLLGIVKW